MFSDPIAANVDVAGAQATTVNYSIVSMNGSNTVRRANAAAAGAPKYLKISHQTVGKGLNARDRHLARFECHSLVDGVEDATKVAALQVVADIPQSGFSAEQLQDLVEQLTGFLRGGSGDSANGVSYSVVASRWLGGES